MTYYVPASNCGDVAQPDHNCSLCPDKEYGRIRKIAIIKTSYLSTIMANPSLDSTWTTAISSGNAWIIPETSGSYDGGSTAENTGFGNQATVNGNTTHILVYKDPNYSENCDFYNPLRQQGGYTLAYVTSDNVHFAGTTVTFSPKNPVGDDINSFVTWEVTCKWINPDSPCPYPKPSTVFELCEIHS